MGESLVDQAIRIVGWDVWKKMSPGVQGIILFDKLCPAGGLDEEDYHRDGSRYWEKTGKARKENER